MYSTQVNAINNGYISFCQDENGGLGATLFQINNSVPGAGSLPHGIDSGYNPFIFILIVPKIGAKVFLTLSPYYRGSKGYLETWAVLGRCIQKNGRGKTNGTAHLLIPRSSKKSLTEFQSLWYRLYGCEGVMLVFTVTAFSNFL